MLVWVEKGGPALAFSVSVGGDVVESTGRQMYPDVLEGCAWLDGDKRRLLHLDKNVFQSNVLKGLSE